MAATSSLIPLVSFLVPPFLNLYFDLFSLCLKNHRTISCCWLWCLTKGYFLLHSWQVSATAATNDSVHFKSFIPASRGCNFGLNLVMSFFGIFRINSIQIAPDHFLFILPKISWTIFFLLPFTPQFHVFTYFHIIFSTKDMFIPTARY